MRKLTPIIPLLLLLHLIGYTQQPGTIRGYVLDKNTGSPLAGANVVILGTEIGTAANINGYFIIKSVPPAEYRIMAQMIGYKSEVVTIDLRGKLDIYIDFKLQMKVLKIGEEVEVIGGSKDGFSIPGKKDIIVQSQIEKMNAATTADIFRSIPGIAISRTGGWGLKPVIRGLKDNRLRVYLDGVPVNQACPMGMDACVATINPDQIERISVEKNGGSSLYGTGNIGGILQITTRKPDFRYDEQLGLRIKTDILFNSISDGKTGNFDISGKYKDIEVLFFNNEERVGNYSSAGNVIENSGYSASSRSLKLNYHPSRNLKTGMAIQKYRARDIGYPAVKAIIPDEKRKAYNIHFSYDNISTYLMGIYGNLYQQKLIHTMKFKSIENKEAYQKGYS
ncbi:MAG: TonB-dependent receptor plug domain-containing protein, partial [Fidelibacterota bacterium]